MTRKIPDTKFPIEETFERSFTGAIGQYIGKRIGRDSVKSRELPCFRRFGIGQGEKNRPDTDIEQQTDFERNRTTTLSSYSTRPIPRCRPQWD